MSPDRTATADDQSLKYDVVVDPTEETSHGKLVRYAGHGKRVLDLGCSTGGVARALVAWDCKVWGVEIDRDAAKLAEPACQSVVVADLDQIDLGLEFEGLAFDVILAGDVLEHLKDPQRLLQQARPLLADGGYLVLSVPNMAHGSVRLALLHGELPPSDTGLLDRTHIQYLTRTLLTALIETSGFSVALMDATVQPIADSEVPFPKDDLTMTVMANLLADPDALIYQYVAVIFPGNADQLPPLASVLHQTSEELRAAREHARAWEVRGTVAESRVAELEQETQDVHADVDRLTQVKLAPLRQELMVARDQLMHRDHDVKRVVGLYEQHTEQLRVSEATRRHLHDEILIARQQTADLHAELAEIRSTRTWRGGQALARLAKGRLSRSQA